MATYTEILDADIAPGQPAFSSVMERMRDNPIAIAQGDASVPAASKIVAAAFKQPTSASQTAILAHQGADQLLGDLNGTVRFFQGIVIVAGAYTFAGTRSNFFNNTIEIYINDVSVSTPSGTTFTQALTLSSGDRIRIDVSSSAASEITLSDFRLLSEIYVPMAQCQFNRFVALQG